VLRLLLEFLSSGSSPGEFEKKDVVL